MSVARGRYRHYKGHIYEVLGDAKNSETTEVMGTAYLRIDEDEPVVWVRPTEMFGESVEGKPRFEKLSEETLKLRIVELERQLKEATSWTDEDKPLPEDDKIEAAHPTRSDEHALYGEAFRMVGAKRSKFALVDLVHWLLVRLKAAEGGKNRR